MALDKIVKMSVMGGTFVRISTTATWTDSASLHVKIK